MNHFERMEATGYPRYLDVVPASLPASEVVVHNHIRPAFPLGMNGFRAWVELASDPGIEACPCGWAFPELERHFRVRRSVVGQF